MCEGQIEIKQSFFLQHQQRYICREVCTRTRIKYYRQYYCGCRIWNWCLYYRYLIRVTYSQEKYCCPGWTYRSYRVCSTPVCSPACRNGGTCKRPNVCSCRDPYEGDICDGIAACSHLKPCFPGRCSGTGQCVCSANFTGSSCLTFQGDSYKADIEKVNATFAYYSYTKNQYAYDFMIDATGKTEVDFVWMNQEAFNKIKFDIDASIDSTYAFSHLPSRPNYIQSYKFGIVDARVNVEHKKLGSGGEYVANTEEYICQHTSDRTPIANKVFECRLHNGTNIIQLDSGDKYTLTCTVKTGGNRVIQNPYTQAYVRQETYSGVSIQNFMEYRFDYDVPQHCKELNTCDRDDVPLKLDKDISRGPFKAFWKGWKDSLSGIKRYALEFWKMEYSKDYDCLREPDILTNYNPVPQYIVEVDENKTIVHPIYEPTEPGVYSVILEVADEANNSRYARQIVMYDDTSEISLDENYRLYAMSASPKANYVWQTTPNSDDFTTTTTIKITWQNRFINKLHHNNHLLSKILDYTPRLSDNIKRVDYKKIEPQFDDNDGVRNKSAINNINAIIQFETVHGVQSTRPPTGWQIVNPLKEDATFELTGVDIRSGDSYQVWVRAHDFMGNTKDDSTVIYFDSSAPNVYTPLFQKNVDDGKYAFSSRVTVSAKDEESGIAKVSFKFIVNGTDEITEQRDFDKAKQTKDQCDSNVKECYCIPKGECFLIDTVLDIDNCWLKVPLDRVKDEIHRLDITVYNMAMIPSTTTYNIGFVDGLHGIRDYFGPSNITIHKPTDSSLSISWVQAPTCYERTGILLRLFKPDNSTEDRKVHKDATTYDLTGLQATTKYRFKLFTKYGNESHPVTSLASEDVQFTTTEKHVGITPVTIGGISGGFVFLLIIVVIVLCFLGRTGRLQPAKARVTQGIRTIRNTVRVHNIYGGVNNRAVSTKFDDDIYYYGQMDLKKIDNTLVISRKDISLESELTHGRFATIYLAKYYGNQRDAQTVVAKVLRDDQNEDNIMKMKAKINFYTENVLHHKNVMDFLGSIQDEVRGPFMVLEYCEMGVLKEFLISSKSNITVDLEERLFRMVFGVCQGMDYLSSKKVVHRRLAARNIFLDHIYEPKIAGFGPDPTGEEEGEERIPIKWMAPECMKSTRNANELSDVYSFGVVMWEIFSLGDTPYPGLQSRDVPAKQKQGYKMKKPECADDAFYQVMLKCWHYDPKKRAGFAQIKEQLNSMFQEGPGEEYYYRSNDM